MKIALVTGATKGIGKSIVLKYLEMGCFVIGIYSNDDIAASLLMDKIAAKYIEKIELIKADLSKISEVENMCEYVCDKYSKIDYLILNAGTTNRNKFGNITFEEWNYVMNVNLNMPFFIVQKFSQNIIEGGRVIFVGSIMGIYSHAISISYAVSKAGVHMLSKQLIKHLSPRKITVNVIAPGFVETTWQKNKPCNQRKSIENKIALKRFAQPDEIAQLCWDVTQNQYINGSLLTIDGGYCYE